MSETALRRPLTGSALKWIALAAMLVDHLGATLVLDQYYACWTEGWGTLYYLCRTVGRVAFPIFCFLLTQGLFHTHSRGRYALRLGLFALVSEIPFDMAIWDPANGFWELGGQNVFFTLLLGFLAIWACSGIARRWPGTLGRLGQLGVVLLAALGAELLHTDYGWFGVLLIASLYWGRAWPGLGQPWHPVLLGSVAVLGYCMLEQNWIEIYALAGLALTLGYNGQRGRGGKWFFYWFYPAHLLILGLLS